MLSEGISILTQKKGRRKEKESKVKEKESQLSLRAVDLKHISGFTTVAFQQKTQV